MELPRMGFGAWIKACVMSASALVIINGSPTPLFSLKQGLRQGDPLSPFLFNLAVEPLNLLIHKAISKQLWDGIEVSKGGLSISHLQYADDTIIFFPKDIDALMNIKKSLIIFHLVFGLQVNFHKSSILGLNLDSTWLQFAADSLQCKMGEFPFTYLGLPIGGNSSLLSTWDLVVNRMNQKLASWKGN